MQKAGNGGKHERRVTKPRSKQMFEGRGYRVTSITVGGEMKRMAMTQGTKKE